MKFTRILISTLLATAASAGELLVVVTGAAPGKGDVGCALYRSADGFPMDLEKAAAKVRLKAESTVECRFKDVPAGTFAVAVSVDLNGNGKTDKNMFGAPTEPWGVSNNVRPSMRPPRYAEASATMPDGDLRIEVKVAK